MKLSKRNNTKKVAMIALTGFWLSTLTACGNRDIIDTTYTYNKAIIRLQNDTVVEGEVQSWIDYSDGDQIQVKIDGVTYLVHSSCVTLISEYKSNDDRIGAMNPYRMGINYLKDSQVPNTVVTE